jgi:hypothetical protein
MPDSELSFPDPAKRRRQPGLKAEAILLGATAHDAVMKLTPFKKCSQSGGFDDDY